MFPTSEMNIRVAEIALHLARSSAAQFLHFPKFVWGPLFGYFAILWKGQSYPLTLSVGNPNQDWKTEWGKQEKLKEAAIWKVKRSLKFGVPTSQLCLLYPYTLGNGDPHHRGGIVDDSCFMSTSFAGLEGFANEDRAKMK